MFSYGFNKRPKHRKFDYIPRYYDEEKEKLDQRLGKYKGDLNEESKMKQRISSQLRQRYVGDESYRRSETKKSTMRVIYILLLLCVITYFILQSTGLERFIESIE